MASGLAIAHDTWFRTEPPERPRQTLLALGTGNRFPVQEIGVGEQYLRRHGCRNADGADVALEPLRDAPAALILNVDSRRAAGAALTCWAELEPFEVELDLEKVPLYLNEINAPPAVREAWAGMHARGLAWKERYTKHARIELPGARSQVRPAAPTTTGMGMDVLLEDGPRPIRAGDALSFQVLRDGTPLAGFAVELRGDRSPVGLWNKTDEQGRVRFRAPLPGQWVLRGTDLRVSDNKNYNWESRFVTLAFEIGPALQNGSSLKLNTRSDSHTAAIPAIAADPPFKTMP